MPVVSVIMIAYNAEATIEAAVSSVAAQTFEDWELVVVDDRSQDATHSLLDELAIRVGERMKVVHREDNCGPAAARNVGLGLASGRWITFIDSDDVYLPSRLETMIDATNDSTDVVVCRHELVALDGTVTERGARAGNLPGPEAAAATLREERTNYVWDKLFRASIVQDLRFPDIRRAEDNVFTVTALMRARNVRYLEEVGYRYMVSTESLTWSRVSPITETQNLVMMLSTAVGAPSEGELAESVRVARVCAFLASAHQGMTLLQGEAMAAHARASAANISWIDVRSTLRARPVLGAAAAVLKLAPGPYAAAYHAYTARRYGV